eukprot:UN03795
MAQLRVLGLKSTFYTSKRFFARNLNRRRQKLDATDHEIESYEDESRLNPQEYEDEENFDSDQEDVPISRRQRKVQNQTKPGGRPSQALTVAFGELAETIQQSVKLSDTFVGPKLESSLYEVGQIQSLQMSLMAAYAEEQQARKHKDKSIQDQVHRLNHRIAELEESVSTEWLTWEIPDKQIPDDQFYDR